MKATDYQWIQRIIRTDVEAQNKKDLIQLREFLEEQIGRINEENEPKEEHLEILNLQLSDFLSTKTYGIKFMRDDIIKAVRKLRSIKGAVLVAHTVGIGKMTILKERGIGPRTISKYERALNQYGYSLDVPLSIEIQNQLKIYQKQK